MSRSRLPLPPVPASSRGAAPAGARAGRPADPRLELPPEDAFLGSAAMAPARGDLLERRRRQPVPAPAVPALDGLEADSSLTSTGRSGLTSTGRSGLRASRPVPRVPMQTTAAGSSSPAYGDWSASSDSDELLAGGPVVSAPGTTAIPERSIRRRAAEQDDDAPAAVRGHGTGPVGGRAAMRAERQAADAARRKAQGIKGSAVAVLDAEDEPRKPRRVLMALVAMAVVALGVLGVYSFVSPRTAETSAQSPTSPSTSAAVVPDVGSLPALPTDPIEPEPVAASPVRVPVTVLNSTDINGLAAKVAATVAGGGWETPGVGTYTAGDVAASTVFFTDGDENQRQAALQLIEMFPHLQGPTPRFFEVPADVQAPGLVVVTTGDWQP